MTKILYIVNDAGYFFSHRFALAKAAQNAGYEIHVAVPTLTESVHDAFLMHHMKPYEFFSEKHGKSEIKAIFGLKSIINNIDPELVHCITLKSSLRWFFLLPCVFRIKTLHTIAGFGQLAGRSLWAQAGKIVMKFVLALQSRLTPSLYVVQNPDDAAELCRQRVIKPSRLFLVQGSGVDTAEFTPGASGGKGPLRLGTACRRLKSKGLPALMNAARLIKERQLKVELHVANVPAKPGHPDGIAEADWEAWKEEGLFIDEGAVEDMPSFYQRLDAFIYLSTSGEGLAKTLLEAASCALPIITTSQPGCKEAVIAGQTGFIVDPHNAQEVTQAIETLMQSPAKARAMGEAGRDFIAAHFADEIVIAAMLKLYQKGLSL